MSIETTLSKVGKELDKAMMRGRSVIKTLFSKNFAGSLHHSHTQISSQYLFELLMHH